MPENIPPAAPRERDWSDFMARAQDGDRNAYRRLLEDIAPYLRFLARQRLQNAGDVEDAVQDVLMTVHAIRHTYDPARPFGPWLVAIAKRRIVDAARRRGRARGREEPFGEGHETFAAPAANLSGEGMDARALAAAMDRLPRGQRDAVRLLKLKEMSLKEAAAATGMSIAALKVAAHRGLKNLRRFFEAQDGKT